MRLKKFKIRAWQLYIISTFTILLISNITNANTDAPILTLNKSIQISDANSENQRASQSEVIAARLSKERSHLHWIPQLYVDGRVFSSNDQSTTLFSKINEKTITASDFTPSQLLTQNILTHYKLSVGIDLPIYEGGAKSAFSKYMDKIYTIKENNQTDTKNLEHSQILNYYGQLVSINQKLQILEKIQNATQVILKNYRIGNSQNLVGKSGDLSLKALSNRLKSEIELEQAKANSIQSILANNWNFPQQWKPATLNILDLIKEIDGHLIFDFTKAPNVQNAQLMSDSLLDISASKKSIYLPKIGLFAENNSFMSENSNNTNNTYTAGAYLQWKLWSQDHYGVLGETSAELSAALARVRQANKTAQSEILINQSQIPILKNQIEILNQNLEIMNEQLQITKSLFQSGSLQALQLAEVYSRFADLLDKKTLLEEELIKTMASTISKTGLKLE